MIAQVSRPSASYSAQSVISQLLEREWSEGRSIPKELLFISTFAMLLLGVTVADGQVTAEEKQRFKEILDNVLPSETKARLLFQRIYSGLKTSRLHLSAEALDCVTQELGASERLLLLVLGHELAMADGDLAGSEAAYLDGIAQRNGVDGLLLQAFQRSLEAGASASGGGDAELERLRYELDPARFRDLNPSFRRAAGRIVERLPKPSEILALVPQEVSTSAVELASDDGLCQSLVKHQAAQEKLAQKCDALLEIVVQSKDKVSFATDLEMELKQLAEKMRSQTFRVAIVGEFSQGKSTLLNALLGEEVQPTRMIPCSGAITVLRYGEQRRVIERYHDGTEQEIPFEDYQERAAIPEDAALDGRTEALSQTHNLKELVLEHPGLELCRHGVELVDSPGLNEHPDRTRLTYQLLKNIDALVFLANASRPLTQGERELLQDFRQRLNGGDDKQPADNLFVLVNFMDLVRRKKDQQQVRQLFENFLFGENALLSSPERLHFTSAQAALDAIVDEVSDDTHLQSLQAFSGALGSFLIEGRGIAQTKRLKLQLKKHCETGMVGLEQIRVALAEAGEIDSKKQAILQILCEATGQFDSALKKVSEQYKASYPALRKTLASRLSSIPQKIRGNDYQWSSNKLGATQEVMNDFSGRLSTSLSDTLEKEIEEFEKRSISPRFKEITDTVLAELEAVQQKIVHLDPAFSENLVKQNEIIQSQLKRKSFRDSLKSNAESDDETNSLLTGAGLAVGVGVAVLTSVTFLPGVLLGGAISRGLKALMKPSDEEIIKRVIDAGLNGFEEKSASIEGQIMSEVDKSFKSLKQSCHKATGSQIKSLNKLIEQLEQANSTSIEEREKEIKSLNSMTKSIKGMMV